MNNRHKDWLKLTHDWKAPPIPKRDEPIKVLTLTGIIDLESKLLLSPPRNGVLSPVVEDYVNSVSRAIFGVTRDDTIFDTPEGYDDLREGSAEWLQIYYLSRDHEDQYATSGLTDDEAVGVLLGLGLDFRDDRHQPLRCTNFLCRQAEAAARGLMGKMPDRAELNLEAWTKKLEQDAQRHMSGKKQPFSTGRDKGIGRY